MIYKICNVWDAPSNAWMSIRIRRVQFSWVEKINKKHYFLFEALFHSFAFRILIVDSVARP